MSGAAAGKAVSSPLSGSMQLATDAAGDEAPSTMDSVSQTPSPTQAQLQSHPPPKSKRYTPPKADANTFATQQAFLDSFQPMSLDEVDVDKRKCPICWKCFGEEPDPGFDNSELPVKLRCQHVFGHKCLADIFGVPASTNLKLQPLQYSSGKKGRLLGQKLAAYHAMHGTKFRNDFETFEHMLNNPHREKGPHVFGVYWWPIFLQILHSHRGLSQITLMENAVVLDYEPLGAKKHKHTQSDPAVMSQYLSAVSSSFEQTLLDASDGYDLQTASAVYPEEVTFLGGQAPSAASPPPALAPGWTSTEWMSLTQAEIEQSGITQEEKTTWEEALAVETNLDKLKALQKQKENAVESETAAAQKLKALKAQAALEEARKQEVERAQAMERRKQHIRASLAHRLVEVFAAYTDCHSQNREEVVDDAPPRVIHASVAIHINDFYKTTYKIASPMMGPFYDEDGDSEDEAVDNLANSTMLILRTQCGGCCAALDDPSLPTPEELTWRNSKNTPDSCPLCHKVLFNKSAGN